MPSSATFFPKIARNAGQVTADRVGNKEGDTSRPVAAGIETKMKISKAVEYSAMATKKETECRTGAAHKDVVCDVKFASLCFWGALCIACGCYCSWGNFLFMSCSKTTAKYKIGGTNR